MTILSKWFKMDDLGGTPISGNLHHSMEYLTWQKVACVVRLSFFPWETKHNFSKILIVMSQNKVQYLDVIRLAAAEPHPNRNRKIFSLLLQEDSAFSPCQKYCHCGTAIHVPLHTMRLFLLPRSMHPARDVANDSFADQSHYKAFSFFWSMCRCGRTRHWHAAKSLSVSFVTAEDYFTKWRKSVITWIWVRMFTCKICVVPVFSCCAWPPVAMDSLNQLSSPCVPFGQLLDWKLQGLIQNGIDPPHGNMVFPGIPV